MAKTSVNTAVAAKEIISKVSEGIFSPVYLLMGEEPYYVDKLCETIIENALSEDERDFNQLICYGADITVADLISNARRYPMFAQRQLVVVKEAQAISGLEELHLYTDAPLESTVLVLVYRGNLDKRKSLYKSILKNGTVLESNPVRDYEVARWITDFYTSKGCRIDPDAAALFGESTGTDLNRIAVETEKLFKNLPEGTKNVTLKDIEQNVGISREFSIFELTKHLSYKDRPKALRTATYITSAAKFNMPQAMAALFLHFNRILKYEALLLQKTRPSSDEISRLIGINAYFLKEYDAAVRNYPLKRCMAVIGLLRDYDFKGKGGNAGEATPAQMMIELVTKILNI